MDMAAKNYLNRLFSLLLTGSLIAGTVPSGAASAGELIDAVKKGDAKKAAEALKKNPLSIGDKEKYETGPLHLAAMKGDKEMIKLLAENKADINGRDYFNKTPLFLASSPEAAETLISLGADIKAVDKHENGLLHEAVKHKKAALAYYYKLKGLDINAKNDTGQTPLSLSVETGESDVFAVLIAAGAEVNSKEKFFEWSPLHIAVMNGRIKMAEVLLEQKAALEAADRLGKTPLHYAKSIEMWKFLISKNANISAASKKGETVLHSAAAANNAELLQFLIAGGGFDVNKKDNEGETALFKTAVHRSKDAAKLLLEKGADIDARDNGGGHILPTAVSSGDTSTVALLLENGADINVKDKYKNGVVHICTSIEMAGLLLKHGADINARDENGCSPLHGVRKTDLCEFLISKGADINAQDARGMTPLMEAASRGNFEIAVLLISKKADTGLKSAGGETAMHFAVRGFNEEKIENFKKIIDALIAKGADINAKANFGDTPIFSAFQPELIKHSIDKGADVNAADNFGRAPLHRAMNAKTAALLLEKGAALEARDINGATPLCHAASYDKELTEFLISKGADVNARGYGRRTVKRASMEHLWQAPILLAAYYRKTDIAELLLAKGAKIDTAGDNGKTALHLAAMDGSKSMIELLIDRGAALNAADKYGNSPLKLSLENDRIEASEILRKRGAK
jgi:ankyrin repeat protein